jgi:hypothetical protein
MLKEKESVTGRITTGTDNLARITNPRQHLCVQQLQIRTSICVFSDYKSATANATDHMARITNPRQRLCKGAKAQRVAEQEIENI